MIRKSKPESGNKYYNTQSRGGYSTCIVGKPTDAGCNVLANCVGYSCGAYNEELGLGYEKYHLNCNAENFIERAIASGLSVISQPTVGAIACWEGLGSKAGHVAIVIEVIDANTIKTAESAYGGSAFYISTRSNNNGRWGMNSNYPFRGFIVNPNYPPQPVPPVPPTPSGDENIKYIQRKLNERYGTNLVADGLFGPATKKGLTLALQKEDNWQYGAGLVEDGIMGPNTARRSPVIRYGADGWITWTIQCMLYCKGYYTGCLDGKYGNGTKTAIGNFQRNNGLSVDYAVGYNTYLKLFS